ncbi:hypothetical protein, partial [Rhodoplanes sp. SY1]|uniref:hypothetical protein n=1 Tax=Rhodoplanes sp. SY1 TaxID=3166646 RepID=UPI0038B66BE8
MKLPLGAKYIISSTLSERATLGDFSLGMDLPQVKSIITSRYRDFEYDERMSASLLSGRGDDYSFLVKSDPFISQITLYRDGTKKDTRYIERWWLSFTPPHSGSSLFGFVRRIDYPQDDPTRPRAASVHQSIDEKWGKE